MVSGLGLIEIDPARGVALRPATKYAISGGIDPRSWRYRLTLNTPSGDVERSAPAAAVVHLRQNVAPSATVARCLTAGGCESHKQACGLAGFRAGGRSGI